MTEWEVYQQQIARERAEAMKSRAQCVVPLRKATARELAFNGVPAAAVREYTRVKGNRLTNDHCKQAAIAQREQLARESRMPVDRVGAAKLAPIAPFLNGDEHLLDDHAIPMSEDDSGPVIYDEPCTRGERLVVWHSVPAIDLWLLS